MKLKSLIKTYGFWTSLAGAIVVLINSLGRIFNFEIEDKLISDVVLAVAGILVVFGIVSVPQELFSQQDEKTEEKQEDPKDKK